MTSNAGGTELQGATTTSLAESAMPYEVAAATASGPKGLNEDSFFVGALKPTLTVKQASTGIRLRGDVAGPQSAMLMIIADGMGGLPKAALASRLAVEEAATFTLENVVHGAIKWRGTTPESSRMTIPGLREQLTEAIQASDARVRKQGEDFDLGSTITLSYLVWPVLYTAHVGDTRAYVIRANQLLQLTQDHRLQKSAAHPASDQSAQYWHHVLWNTLGDRHNLARPELSRFVLESHDQWLLCSDGLYGALSAAEILELCHQGVSVRDGALALVQAARNAGADDDVTVIYGRQSLNHSVPSGRRHSLNDSR